MKTSVEENNNKSIFKKSKSEQEVLYTAISANYFYPSVNSEANNLFCLRNFYYNANSYFLPDKTFEVAQSKKRETGKYSLKKINEIIALLVIKTYKRPLPFSGLQANGTWCSAVLYKLNYSIWKQIYSFSNVPEENQIKQIDLLQKEPEIEKQNTFKIISIKNDNVQGIRRRFFGGYNVNVAQSNIDTSVFDKNIQQLRHETIGVPRTEDQIMIIEKRNEIKSSLFEIDAKWRQYVSEKDKINEMFKKTNEDTLRCINLLQRKTGKMCSELIDVIKPKIEHVEPEDIRKIVSKKFSYTHSTKNPESCIYENNGEFNSIMKEFAEAGNKMFKKPASTEQILSIVEESSHSDDSDDDSGDGNDFGNKMQTDDVPQVEITEDKQSQTKFVFKKIDQTQQQPTQLFFNKNQFADEQKEIVPHVSQKLEQKFAEIVLSPQNVSKQTKKQGNVEFVESMIEGISSAKKQKVAEELHVDQNLLRSFKKLTIGEEKKNEIDDISVFSETSGSIKLQSGLASGPFAVQNISKQKIDYYFDFVNNSAYLALLNQHIAKTDIKSIVNILKKSKSIVGCFVFLPENEQQLLVSLEYSIETMNFDEEWPNTFKKIVKDYNYGKFKGIVKFLSINQFSTEDSTCKYRGKFLWRLLPKFFLLYCFLIRYRNSNDPNKTEWGSAVFAHFDKLCATMVNKMGTAKIGTLSVAMFDIN